MELEIEMLIRIREGKQQHDRECDQRCHAVLLNPGNWKLIGWDEVLGLAVLPDPRIEAKRFEIVCDVSVGGRLGMDPIVWTHDGQPRLVVPPPRE